MKHVFWLYPGEIAGRPGPDFAPWRLGQLRSSGIDAVLSVAEELFDGSEASAAGLDYAWLPFPSVAPPGPEDEELCRALLPEALRLIDGWRRAGKVVLVHCAAGKDRTGLVMATYVARREGLEASKAIARVRGVRANALTAYGWEELALRLLRRRGQPSG